MTKILGIVLYSVYASVPAFLYLYPGIMNLIVFSNTMLFPSDVDLSRPELLLNHTTNFYVNVEEGVTLGVWHTLPASQWAQSAGKSPAWYQATLGDGNPVVLYLHGQRDTRALDYRVELVKVLSASGYHVISFDYRGFGDSTGSPTEPGLTRDSVFLYDWVKNHSRGLVVVWGHSLGAGVATNTVLDIQKRGSTVDALVLYAPFTNIKAIISMDEITRLYNFLPGFNKLLCDILDKIDVTFDNEKNVKNLTCPILFINSEDDGTVPFQMGVKLYNVALQVKRDNNRNVPIDIVTFSGDLGYGHNHIYRDPRLPTVIGNFLRNVTRTTPPPP